VVSRKIRDVNGGNYKKVKRRKSEQYKVANRPSQVSKKKEVHGVGRTYGFPEKNWVWVGSEKKKNPPVNSETHERSPNQQGINEKWQVRGRGRQVLHGTPWLSGRVGRRN